jgi:hypothetical protein
MNMPMTFPHTFRIPVVVLFLACFSLPCHCPVHRRGGRTDSGIESLRATSKAFSSVAKRASPSVVFIQVEGRGREDAYTDARARPSGRSMTICSADSSAMTFPVCKDAPNPANRAVNQPGFGVRVRIQRAIDLFC